MDFFPIFNEDARQVFCKKKKKLKDNIPQVSKSWKMHVRISWGALWPKMTEFRNSYSVTSLITSKATDDKRSEKEKCLK